MNKRTEMLSVMRVAVVAAGLCAAPVAWGAPAGVPCGARADAAIANTGVLYSNSNSLIDSYQSSLGAYGGSNVGSNGNVQTGTTIVQNGGVIHGTETQHTPGGFTVVPVPAGAINLPLGSSSPGFVNINNASQSITLAPGNYVAQGINLNAPTGAINVSPPGQVNIWVTQNLNLGGSANLNGVPENLQFLVTSNNSVSINGGKVFGFVYAPNASVNVNGSVFGGVVGTTVTINSGSAVHLDTNSACATAPPVNQAALSAGFLGACALDGTGANSTVKCWGNDSAGELGSGVQNNNTQGNPVVTAIGQTGAVAVSANANETCDIDAAGGVKCWGNDTNGELGTNGVNSPTCAGTCSEFPVQVTGITSGATELSTGSFEVCAVVNGGAFCWGHNSHGELGNGNLIDSAVPVAVTGLGSGVKGISVGGATACAINSAGGAECWGFNSSGELGNNSTTDSSVPVPVTGLSSGVTAIAVGIASACAIQNGALFCWGDNSTGELGNNSNTPSAVPVAVSGLGSGVAAVTVGGGGPVSGNGSGGPVACAVTAASGAVCWGDNGLGSLGNSGVSPSTCQGTPCSLVPQPVTGLASGVTAISAGQESTCALTTGGVVQCWGLAAFNQLGDNNVGPAMCGPNGPCAQTPENVVGIP